MNDKEPLLEQYAKYRDQVYDSPISEVQDTELRRAFMAGATCGFMKATDLPETEEESLKYLDDLHAELEKFLEGEGAENIPSCWKN